MLIVLHPERRLNRSRRARETLALFRNVFEEAQLQVRQQPDPDLPLDRFLGVATKSTCWSVYLSSLIKFQMAQRAR